MKAVLFFTLSAAQIFFSCSSNPSKLPETGAAAGRNLSSAEINIMTGDTINRIDVTGRKQGHWVYLNHSNVTKIIEEGDYLDNLKNGWWMYYDSSGKLARKIYFKNDKAM